MADNITLDPGTGGSTLASDDISGVQHQRVKIQYGVDGAATDVSDTNPLPIDDAGGSLTVDNAALSVTGGGVEASALRVTLASDSTGVVSVDDAGGSLTVDGTVTANAGTGTFTIQEAAAMDVSAATVTVDLGANNDVTVQGEDAENAAAAANPVQVGGRYDLTPRTLGDGDVGAVALDADGAVQISDGGNTITVDGTVTADAGTGPWPVTDNGGSLTVDNAGTFAVQVDGDALTALQTLDNSVFADDAAFTLTSSSVTVSGAIRDDTLGALSAVEGDAVPLRVNSTGALHVTGAGGGTQYNIDDAAGGTDTGTVSLAIRDDALTTLTPADGDYVPLRVSSTGALHVTGGGGGTEYTDDTSTHATGSTTGGIIMAAATPTDGSIDANDIGAVAMSTDRRLHVDSQIVGQDADVTIADGGNSITVDNAGTFAVQVDSALPAGTNAIGKLAANTGVDIGDVDVTSVVPGTGATNLGKAEDAVHTTGDVGVMALSVRTNTATARSGTDGDYQPLITDTNGRLHVKLLANEAVNVAQMNGVTTSMGNGVSGTGVQRVTLASDSTGQVKLAAGTAAIGKLSANTGVDIGDVDVTSISAGTNLIGDVGLSGARTSGGTTIFRSIDLDESEEEVKGTAGQLYWLHAMNLSAAVKYLKVYNATAASVIVGTTTPVLTFPIPTQGDTNGAGFMFSVPNGVAFSTAITVAATTGIADADTGAPGANEVIVNIGYA